MEKKVVLLHTDFSLRKTGFGKVARHILTHLYKTGKYILVNYCCASERNSPEHSLVPWTSVGCLPPQEEINGYMNMFPQEERPARWRQMGYGSYDLDRVIERYKPDVYIGTQDIWGVDYSIDKPWFNKINSVIWTTLDSLPLLPSAVEKAPKIENYWVWSEFATKEMHRLGHKHVKTMHGPVDDSYYYKISHEKRSSLRKKFKIPEDSFIIGFVFRNQLRKSVPNLLEGYSIWKKKHEKDNTFLHLHTHFSEGWNILKLAKEYNVNPKEILTTYVCKNCKDYVIHPFVGQNVKCPYCGQTTLSTTCIDAGVTEEQLNEVYNLMDVYCHPFTSGGQEVPIVEAKLTELITLVTNYSCGEEMCQEGSGSLPLAWAEYREHETEFRKASTLPSSIAENIEKVYLMSPQERKKIGETSRQWAIQNFSIGVIGKLFEDFIDSLPAPKPWEVKEEEKNPQAVIGEIKDNKEWLKRLYKDILKMDVPDTDSGLLYWMQAIAQGKDREEIENYFRQVALQENQKKQVTNFEDLLNKNDKKKVCISIPESIGDIFMVTSLLKSVRERYPKESWDLYFATKPEYFELLDCNPYIDKVIPFVPEMDSLLWAEGKGSYKGYFDVFYPVYYGTQRLLNYLHNAQDTIDFEIKYPESK